MQCALKDSPDLVQAMAEQTYSTTKQRTGNANSRRARVDRHSHQTEPAIPRAFPRQRYARLTHARFWLGMALLCLVSGAFTTACRKQNDGTRGPVGKLTFALPAADWWTAAPFLTSQSRPFFQGQGLELATFEVPSGLASKNAVLAGTADIGLSAATPLALAAAKGERLVVLGTYLHSAAVIGLVRPRDLPANSLPPEPVAIVPSTISESYLYQYLTRINKQALLEQKKLQTLQQRPADIPAALRTGSAKSAVIWEPFLSLSAEQTGYTVDKTADFQVNLYLITRPEVYERRRDEINAFLRGVADSCRYLREHSDDARHQLEHHFGFRADFLAATWTAVEYDVNYTPSKDEVVREAQTAKALGYISEVPNVDYLFSAAPPQ